MSAGKPPFSQGGFFALVPKLSALDNLIIFVKKK